jgi:probable rRNA maturation factor
MIVQFFSVGLVVKLSDKRRLKGFLGELFKREGVELASIKYIFCNDDYLLAINREFLRHDNYTDIITFCLSEASEPVEGEVYISTDRISENSAINGVSFSNELHRIIFHGALHLCGYKDKKPSDKRKMTAAENKNLEVYFK